MCGAFLYISGRLWCIWTRRDKYWGQDSLYIQVPSLFFIPYQTFCTVTLVLEYQIMQPSSHTGFTFPPPLPPGFVPQLGPYPAPFVQDQSYLTPPTLPSLPEISDDDDDDYDTS